MMNGDDLGQSVLIHLDVESLNPAIVNHETPEKSEFSTTRKCYSYIKKKVRLVVYICVNNN